MTERVGFIGVGTMGLPMATNILSAGFNLMAYDRRPEPLKELGKRGAKIANSIAEVAQHGEVIEIAVAPEAEVEAVILGPDGILSSARPGTVIDIHSTAHPSTLQRIAQEARLKGVAVLDAQMSGGDRGVRERTLCYMVGGDAETLECCRPIMSASGTNIFHLGGIGMGAVAKVAQNTMVAMNLLSAYEGFVLAKEVGVDPEVFQEVVRTSAAQSHMADDWLEHWSARESPNVYQWILETALSLAESGGFSLPGAALTKGLMPKVFAPKGPRSSLSNE